MLLTPKAKNKNEENVLKDLDLLDPIEQAKQNISSILRHPKVNFRRLSAMPDYDIIQENLELQQEQSDEM